ncbi:MAG: hypothetical protein AAF808_18015 [Cyanobacteria bacterium P01_D01_bin.2]
MVHGLLWLPLLVFFFWITWAGWNEYRKVETYKQWATQFERAKYDIYAALGQADRTLTWGRPTRQGIVELESAQLDQVDAVDLLLKGDDGLDRTVKGAAVIQLQLGEGRKLLIPFTDAALAAQWHQFLAKTLAVDGAG